MKPFEFEYPWTDRTTWMLPDDEEMMKGQFPILDEQIDFVLEAVGRTNGGGPHHTCVQAGGAFGMYPLRLADHFEKVLTFEPLTANLECLVRNLNHRENVTVSISALWHEAARLSMKYSKPVKNSYGAHHVSTDKDDGEFCFGYPLDDWELEDVDLLWLDIEGAEVYALMGAGSTIRRCQPVIVIEEAKHLPQHKELGVRVDSASAFLKRNHRYKEFGRTHGDLIFVPS